LNQKRRFKNAKGPHKDFKFKVALEAIRGDLTIAQIVSKYQVEESLVHKWKKQLLDSGGDIFECKK
jgi:transposase